MWEVSGTDEFAAWYSSLDAKDQSKVDERVELLAQNGPALRRPVVGEITTSSYQNMKEVRAKSGRAHLRVLFFSTRVERRSFCWAVTRPRTASGTSGM